LITGDFFRSFLLFPSQKKMTKRKEITESPIDCEISIKVIDAEVAKNKKLYKGLPETFRRASPPENDLELWFDFSKQWHPIGLFDAGGKLIVSKNTLHMEISNQPSTKDEIKPKPFSATAVATKGVYWFSVPNPYVGGTFTYKFTSAGANALIHKAEIDDGNIVTSPKARTSSVDMSATKLLPGSAKAKPKKESAVPLIKEVNPSKDDSYEEPQTKKQKVQSAAEVIRDNCPKIRVVKAAGSGRSGGIGGSSSPVPVHGGGPRLSYKSRIERSATSSAATETSSKTNLQQIVKVKGPILEISLPISLTVALLDDRANVDSGKLEVLPASGSVSEADSMMSSTVTELLNKVHLRAKHSIAECDVLILRIRQLFECLFETSILYSSERAAMKQQLNQIRADRMNFADHFGGIYLLRLLILIVTGADSIYPSSEPVIHEDLGLSEPCAVSTSAASDAAKSGEMALEGSAPSSSASSLISQSSKLRRSAIMSKHHKMEFYKFQEVIDCALKELDESAHTIF
jgi:MRG